MSHHFMLIHHKVKDYAKWKAGYDAHVAMRREAGLEEKQLLRSEDDPNEVTAIFEATNLQRAREFAKSPDLQKTMDQVGVVGKPNITFLRD
jgi:hypothetical protein